MNPAILRSQISSPDPQRRRVIAGLAGLAGGAAAVAFGMPAFAQGRTLRIGTTFDNSGIEKSNGSGLFQGSNAYFNALNLKGGIQGTKVELVMADDRFDPALAGKNAQAFAADPTVMALLHPLGTRQTEAVYNAAPRLAVVGPFSGSVALRESGGANVFWVRADYEHEVRKLVETMTVLKATRVGIVCPDDAFGQPLLESFKKALAKAKIEPVLTVSTPSTISTQVEHAAAAIARAQPQVVLMALAGTAPAFVRALRKAGGTSAIYGLSILASAGVIREMGDLARGLGFSIVVPSPFATRYGIVRRYQADMLASGFKEFSLPSLEGYIDACVLAEGLRRAGKSLTRASLITALERIDNYDLGGLKIGFAPGSSGGSGDSEGDQFVDVAVIGANGRLLA